MKSSKTYRLLKQGTKILLVLIAFFSLNLSVSASSFAYNAFDWDKFYNENINYWTDYCGSASAEISEEECIDIVLTGKKQFYIKLYKLLAKYERKGYKLNDNIILATAFFGLTPDTFTEIPEEFRKEYRNGSAYNLDLNEDIESYDVDTDESQAYYENETDSLKTLIKHMFAYPGSCNGSVGVPQLDDNGNKVCNQGTLQGDTCVGLIKTFNLNYTEYLINKWGGITKLLGIKDKNSEECNALSGTLSVSNKKEINYDEYWEFLTESSYFDNKIHLNNRYASILEKTEHKWMKDLTDDEKEPYNEDLIKVRKMIIMEIKSLLETYGEFAQTPDSYISAGGTSNSMWWPIGSDEVTDENGILFATGQPVSTHVSSVFGPRIHPIKKTLSNHTGIDIGQVVEGVTNVIAVKDGVVVYPTDGSPVNCPSSRALDSCGGGYGNYVIIQHSDGTYSMYAHLYSNSITVRANDSVRQGQVIGKIGSSGNSTGPHLHFEIRVGNNSSSSSVDPLNYISADNPRSISVASGDEFTKMLHWFEGGCNAKTNGNNYVVHDDGYGIPTVGYGVALRYNIDNFKKYNINVSNMTFGDEIPINIVDEVANIKINSFRSYVQNYLAKNSITLTDYQVDCLTMVTYQFGDLGNFATMYQKYGNTNELKNTVKDAEGAHYFIWNPSTANNRAGATWKLFNEGIYTYGEKCN